MMKKVEKFITDNEIFKHGDSVVLGVSGGADSTCLLYVLNDLKEKLDLKLLVVHVNHGIRGEEADRDAMHVKKMCEKLNVPFRLKEVNVPSISKETGKSEEEAGRDARYAAFFEIAKDVNVACDGDGQNTSGLAAFILLSIITCGIYTWFWYYNLGNRLAANAPRYGMTFQENGTTILLWQIFGSFLCGIGPFVAMYILIKNTNQICNAYNRKHGL